MNRRTFRHLLMALLLISGGFASWSWLRPYEWSADPQAKCRVVGSEVRIDHDNYWLVLHLKVRDGEKHDLSAPVFLTVSNGRRLEPADTTLAGDEQLPIREIWFKFWLEREDFEGPVELDINRGRLKVRSGRGMPKLRASGSRYFVTHHW